MALWNGELEWSGNGINYRLDGEALHIRLHWRILPDCESTWECVLISIENITALKRAETRFHHLFTYASSAGKVIWVVGAQKLVRDLDEGMKRIDEYSVPLEEVHMQELYKAHTAVSKLLIVNKEIKPDRITMIIVKEELGF